MRGFPEVASRVGPIRAIDQADDCAGTRTCNPLIPPVMADVSPLGVSESGVDCSRASLELVLASEILASNGMGSRLTPVGTGYPASMRGDNKEQRGNEKDVRHPESLSDSPSAVSIELQQQSRRRCGLSSTTRQAHVARYLRAC